MLNKNPKYTDALNDKEGLIQKDTAMEMKKWASKVKRTIKEGRGRKKGIIPDQYKMKTNRTITEPE